MKQREPSPGVSREVRIGDEGLQRLEAQLARGGRIGDAVLRQWIRRYGDAARELIRRYGQYRDEWD
jgi:hypothetical protein